GVPARAARDAASPADAQGAGVPAAVRGRPRAAALRGAAAAARGRRRHLVLPHQRRARRRAVAARAGAHHARNQRRARARVQRPGALHTGGGHRGDPLRLLRPRRQRDGRRGALVARPLGQSAAPAAARAHRRDAEARRAVADARGGAARGARGRLPLVRSQPPAVRRRMSRVRTDRCASPFAQRGIALILALWITVLLTVVASGFAFSMRSEALATRNALSLAQARAVADGAVERMAYELGRPQLPDTWHADGSAHTWQDGDATVLASAVDEAARVDLNYAPDALLKSLLLAQGAEDARAAQLVDAILDWRDNDDLKRPNGAEDADYRAAGLKYGPTNGPFETVA